MDNAFIYHGGTKNNTGYSQRGKSADVALFTFGKEGNLPVNSFLEPPNGGISFGTGTGYYTSKKLDILSVCAVIHEFRTNNDISELSIDIRYISSVPTPTPLTLSSQGSLCGFVSFVLPNTNSVLWYNTGKEGVKVVTIPENSIIFAVVSVDTALFLHGSNVIVRAIQR